jgi:hypothetical protein
MAIVEAINIPIGVTGTETVQQAANSYEDLGDAVAKTQREAERLALQYGVNDAKTQEAIQTAARYKNQLEQLDSAIDLNRSSLDLLLSATQSVVGGFQAAIGATALFGQESEQLTRLLVKVQGAIALGEGLNNLKELPKVVRGIRANFIRLNTTLSTTQKLMRGLGIGAVIAGIVLLVKNIDGLIDKFKSLTDSLGLTNYELERQVKNQEAITKNLEREISLNEALGKSEEEILKQKIKLAQENEKLANLQLQYAEFQKEGVEEATQATLDAVNNTKIAEANLTQFYDEQAKARLELAEELREYLGELEDEDFLKREESLKKIFDLTKYWQTLGRNSAVANRLTAQNELQEQLKTERDLLEDSLEAGYITQQEYDDLNLKQNDAHKQRMLELDRQYLQEKRDLEEKSATEVSDMLLDLNSVFQGQRENQNKQEFEREKALNIAQTLISTYFAAQRAYASQLTATPDAPIRATIAAAAAVASGLARVAAIRRTTFNSESPTTTSATGGGAAVPRFNAPTTRLPQTDEFTQVRRVYVTERDITNVQDKVRVTESLSQF